jgi:hypothetical protein
VQPTVLVLSDLVSRRAAMDDFAGRYPVGADLDDVTQQRLLENLGQGADAAAHFSSDLTALEAAAHGAPAFTPAAPDSRAAAEIAVLAADVQMSNYGCDGHGGTRITSLPAIVWQSGAMPDGTKIDGTVETVPFRATWTNGDWLVVIYAC